MQYVPTYVYVLLCVLVYVGIRRCYPRTIRVERTIVFPLAFVLLGASSVNRLFPGAGWPDYALALFTLAAGIVLGWLHASRWRLGFEPIATVDDSGVRRRGMRVRLPGDPSLLVTLLLMFALEGFLHYAVETRQPWAASEQFVSLAFAAWGMLAGMPLGRALNVLVRSIRAAGERSSHPATSFE
ncbi:hypothetical protein [Trinickia fusca]|uniref:DUF1453 family protein n=1 Tax=Trinickia fusca TaxID=2419777 RepID=A0A494XEL8_9BURK|nr:hypothetical protein [Trinickia fusca]RKP48332.1 hypothetical protein D7S89_13540 [Trinickia fusca]